MDISALDRKILYELGNNARMSHKEIAQKIGSKKTVVAYHIQRLMEDKVIWKFVPVVSLSRLGLYGFKMYVRFSGLDKETKERMISELVKNPSINWVAESTGEWDLLWSTLSSNALEFAEQKNAFIASYGRYIQEYSITTLEDALVFNRDYLVEKSLSYRKEFVFGGANAQESVDKEQKRILFAIRNDGRFQVTKLTEELGLNVRTVLSKISDLEKRKILQGYTIFLNIQSIGLKFFKLCLYFQDFSKENYENILSFCKAHRNIIHIIKCIGNWDLEVEIEAENVEQIYSLIEDIKTRYPKAVKKIDIVIITKEHKLEFFPEN